MSYLFWEKDQCNPNISGWDVLNVKDFVSHNKLFIVQTMIFVNGSLEISFCYMVDLMLIMILFLSYLINIQKYMFKGAEAFNWNIGNGDVSSGQSFVSIKVKNIVTTINESTHVTHNLLFCYVIFIHRVPCLKEQ